MWVMVVFLFSEETFVHIFHSVCKEKKEEEKEERKWGPH
jgi:hypothetical protein